MPVLFTGRFSKPIAIEAYADCSDCNMCQPNSIVSDQRFFRVNQMLPFQTHCDYLIGGIINDKAIKSKSLTSATNKSPR